LQTHIHGVDDVLLELGQGLGVELGGFSIFVNGFEGFDQHGELPLKFGVDLAFDFVAQFGVVLLRYSLILDESFAEFLDTGYYRKYLLI
jgi:hypothetical protein